MTHPHHTRNLTPRQRHTNQHTPPHPGDDLLTPGEVAALFRVDPKTVTRWATAGRVTAIRTPGGHRRYWRSEIRALLQPETTPPAPTCTTCNQPTTIDNPTSPHPTIRHLNTNRRYDHTPTR